MMEREDMTPKTNDDNVTYSAAAAVCVYNLYTTPRAPGVVVSLSREMADDARRRESSTEPVERNK